MLIKIPPPVDMLLADIRSGPLWLDKIWKHPAVVRQRKLRHALYRIFSRTFEAIPDPREEIEDALRSGKVKAQDLTRLYNRLTEFLTFDPDHIRIILYLPLELIPNLTSGFYTVGSLAKAARAFVREFLKSWRSLLIESDYRAHFVDGDFLPLELLDDVVLPHVRKAAHLIPEMVQKGILSRAEILDITKQTDDEVLAYSILDALPVLADMGLFSDDDWKRFSDALRLPLSKAAVAQYRVIRPNTPMVLAEALPKISSDARGVRFLSQLDACLKDDLTRIWQECEDKKVMSALPSRVAWLRMERKGQCIEEYAEAVGEALLKKRVTSRQIAGFIRDFKNDTRSILGIISVRKATEGAFRRNRQSAIELQNFFHQIFREVWLKHSPLVKDQIFIVWSHWYAMGLLGGRDLQKLGLAMPKLDAFSAQHELIDNNLAEIKPLLEDIYSRPEARELIYPVFVFYGSRLKGYAFYSNSDLDLAVFVRPEVPEDKKPILKELFAAIAAHPKVKGKILEFWLERADGGLKLRDMPTRGTMAADNSWLHVLWYGVWYGEENSVEKLYHEFLPRYIYSTGQIIDGKKAKSIWLRMMEMEIIQYRLLHKGYLRYFPPEKRRETEHSWPIDSSSTFWDPKFRRVATKLFVGRVFLPELERT